MRLIDWKRGNPYVWHKDDFGILINSDRLFARKFSSSIDKAIVEELTQTILKRQSIENNTVE